MVGKFHLAAISILVGYCFGVGSGSAGVFAGTDGSAYEPERGILFAPALGYDGLEDDLGGGGERLDVGLSVELRPEPVVASRAETSGVFDR